MMEAMSQYTVAPPERQPQKSSVSPSYPDTPKASVQIQCGLKIHISTLVCFVGSERLILAT